MVGATVLFRVYETLVGEHNSSLSILGAGAMYRTVVTAPTTKTDAAAVALRSMLFYALLFWGYETIMSLLDIFIGRV